MPTYQSGSLIRAYFSLLAFHTVFSGFFEPKSLHFLVVHQAGDLGYWIIVFTGVLGVISLVDTIVNDVLPEKYSFHNGLNHRHLVFMSLALAQAAEMFVSLHYVYSWGLALFCLLNVVFLTIAAFRDVQIRYKGTKECCN